MERARAASAVQSTREDAPVISVENLTKRYRVGAGDEVTALEDISFDIAPGSVVGVLGPNGAGKTTLIKCILDLVLPTSGEVSVDGQRLAEQGNDLYGVVSAMLEGARNIYWRLSVRENIEYFTGIQGIDPATVAEENEAIIEAVGLTDRADEPVNKLSRGMKQKVALACTLARRTPVVFLDEPTLGLDVEAKHDLLSGLRGLVDGDERTVVLNSHDMQVVQDLCERVVILNDGRIVADEAMDELLEMFEVRTYRFTVEELPPRTRQQLDHEYSQVEWDLAGRDPKVTVSVTDPDEFYRLAERLESLELTIKSVESVDDNLEEAFLRITRADTDSNRRRSVSYDV